MTTSDHRYHLPYCVDVTKLLAMTCQFISKTEVGSRSELFGAIEAGARPRAALDDSAVDAAGSAQSEKFNRKRDRYDFKVDQSQPKPERQYADGVPLLMDLSK